MIVDVYMCIWFLYGLWLLDLLYTPMSRHLLHILAV